MNDKLNSMILYTNSYRHDILENFAEVCLGAKSGTPIQKYNRLVTELLNVASEYCFDFNAWKGYIALVLLTSNNVFTRMCERRPAVPCTVTEFARRDLSVMYELYNFKLDSLDKCYGADCMKMLMEFHGNSRYFSIGLSEISEKVRRLISALDKCTSTDSFFDCVCGFYDKYGVGTIGLDKCFHINTSDDELVLTPLVNTERVTLDDIIGYDCQKKLLYDNTKAFIDGKPANNVLLYGDSGTGKSTSIKAIVNELYDEGLRMIEIYKHQMIDLPRLMSFLKEKNYKFIVYLDDLSFEEDESEYKYLKAVIEGGAQSKPDNVLIYATSNRRHLIKESWSDRENGEMRSDVHSSDTLEEKLSLSARFGLTVYYPKPGRNEYMDIVYALARKNNIGIEKSELEDQARVWEMHHGGISGRTAAQFIANLLGNQY